MKTKTTRRTRKPALPTLQTTISAGRTNGRYLLITPDRLGGVSRTNSRVVEITKTFSQALEALSQSRRRHLIILTFSMDGSIFRQCEIPVQ